MRDDDFTFHKTSDKLFPILVYKGYEFVGRFSDTKEALKYVKELNNTKKV